MLCLLSLISNNVFNSESFCSYKKTVRFECVGTGTPVLEVLKCYVIYWEALLEACSH